MFAGANSFNQPLNNWNVSNVTNMNYMFENATSFNQPLNKWNVSNVTDMWCMFWGAESFNQPLNNWNVSNVTDTEGMFQDASSFNQPLHAPSADVGERGRGHHRRVRAALAGAARGAERAARVLAAALTRRPLISPV